MTATVYPKTATKAKNGTVFAFGRRDELRGKETELGGYYVFKLCKNYDGKARGGIRTSWRHVGENLSYGDAVSTMNKRCGYTAFNEPH